MARCLGVRPYRDTPLVAPALYRVGRTRTWGPRRGRGPASLFSWSKVEELRLSGVPLTQSASGRRRSLEAARNNAPGGAVIPVDDVKFDRFVAGIPRQYESIVYFTAADATYKCGSCR